MTTILVHANDDAGQEARLQAALAVARAANGHLLLCQTTSLTTPIAGDMYAGFLAAETIAAISHDVKQAAQRNREQLQARMGPESIGWDWLDYYGEPAEVLVEQSKLADLIVLSLAPSALQPRGPLPLVGDVSLYCRTPVLALPIEATRYDPLGVAMIAWNGSAESANALRANLPLLRLAREVVVTMVYARAGEPEEAPAADVCRYLSRHGVKARALDIEERGDVAEALLKTAKSLHASYVLMGAYGRSRVMEVLFGGVTRTMLANQDVPLLLAH
jgi:nucleotide-binding universal stress UspA family protein